MDTALRSFLASSRIFWASYTLHHVAYQSSLAHIQDRTEKDIAMGLLWLHYCLQRFWWTARQVIKFPCGDPQSRWTNLQSSISQDFSLNAPKLHELIRDIETWSSFSYLDSGSLRPNFLLCMEGYGCLILHLCFVQPSFDSSVAQPGFVKMLIQRGIAQHGLDLWVINCNLLGKPAKMDCVIINIRQAKVCHPLGLLLSTHLNIAGQNAKRSSSLGQI